MGSCGNLASADEPLSCGVEAQESVSEQLTSKEAAENSLDSNANACQVSSCQGTEPCGIEGGCSPGHCDKTGSPVPGNDGKCNGNGGFEGESWTETDALGREGLTVGVRVGNLQDGDRMAVKLTSGVGCPDNTSDQNEAEDGMRGDGHLLKDTNVVEEMAGGPLMVEAGANVNPHLVITKGECCNETEAMIESKIISSDVVIAQESSVMNDQSGNCPSETCDCSVNENTNHMAEVEYDTCDMMSLLETSEKPSDNDLSSSCPDEKNTERGDNNASVLLNETAKDTSEEIGVIDMDKPRLPSNETDGAVDNLCPAESVCCAVPETFQEDDRNVGCLSSEEALMGMTMLPGAVAKLEAELCMETLSFQVNEVPVEEKNVDVLPLNHDQMSNSSDTVTDCSLINEIHLRNRVDSHLQSDTSVSVLEKKSGGLISGMATGMSSGIKDVKDDGVSCQVLLSEDDRGTSEGLSLSSASQLDGREDRNVAAETDVEHAEEGNAHPLDDFFENGTLSPQLKEIDFKSDSLPEGSIALLSSNLLSTVKDCSLKSTSDVDVQSALVAAATTASSANGYPNDRKPDSKSEYIHEIESPIFLASSSNRSSHLNKSGRKIQAKRASRCYKNASKVAQHYEALELIFEAAKKKRTCFSKTPRSSTWGVMQNIAQHFERTLEAGNEPSQKPGSRKVKIGRGRGKQSKNVSGGTSQVSKENVGVSSGRFRLKVRMGKEVVMFSEVVKNPASVGAFASASCGGSVSDVAKLTDDVKINNPLDSVDAKRDNGKLCHGDPLANGCPSLIAKRSAQDGGGCLDLPMCDLGSVGAVEDRFLDSETSPDSEVINLIPETQISERHQEGINDPALNSSKNLAPCEDVPYARKGKKKDKVPHQSSCGRKSKSVSGSSSSSSKKRGCKVKVDESFNTSKSSASLTSADLSNNPSNNIEPLPSPNDFGPAFSKGPLNIEIGADTYPGQDISAVSINLEHLRNGVISSAKKKGQKQVKSSKSGKVGSGRSTNVNSTKRRKGASCKQKKGSEKLASKSKVKEKEVLNQFQCRANDDALAGNASKMEAVSAIVEQQVPPRNAWVSCDDCHKWRRIAAALADSIEDANINWTCKDNLDKRFADCSIPQEMSNGAINAELELSDCEDDCDGNQNHKELKGSHSAVSQESSFVQIDTNKFLHRKRRTQTIDEVMVCHCKPPLDGKLGCGDECLNRMLNIECVQGTCPCGDLCSNQQFQKRKYAKLQWFRCGKKGYGLQLLEDVSQGKFIIEYVGEVLDIPAYEERQRDYAAKGHKHFYFMTLNGSEVIDACVKGNLGRFINHSCDPNCRTEKWMVNGEICIGLFAIRDIKKGEEVTFDYNYVRVFGAAAKKCVCGSPLCRGYIGGDLQSTETIFQVDSDDEFPEPVMLDENGDVAYKFDNSIPQIVGRSDVLVSDLLLKDKSEVIKELENTQGSKAAQSQSVSSALQSDRLLDVEGRAEKALLSHSHAEMYVHSKDVKSKPLPKLQRKISAEGDALNLNYTDTPEMSEPPSRSVSNEKGDVAESRPLVKARRPSSTVKKSKASSDSQNVNKGQGMASKIQMVSVKPKKVIEGSSGGRFEAVQETLNELLDADGGISKRKDATKGYLKLLLLTAASGDSGNGEAIQSNRDVSMILDALLKTRSRLVLMDIINKNGLRMLHNMMKKYRRDFKKIPILRKLLKVLEYLAAKEILTLEHIIVGPPCPGMESFRESILSFTEHDDKQVHQIARLFRDRWIPRHLRRVVCADRDDGINRGLSSNSLGSQTSISATTSSVTDNSTIDGANGGTKTRKRKSRWDSDTNPYLESLKHREESNCEEEGPPGFTSPPDTSHVSSSNSLSTASAIEQTVERAQYSRCPFDAVIGQPQERFKSQSPVSYGVPLLILQQFGTPQAVSIEKWAIAPGMPFHPYPPLPPYPRDKKRRSPPSSSSDCMVNSTICSNSFHSSADEKNPEHNLCQITESASLAEFEGPRSESQQMMVPFKRLKASVSQDLGKRYFRQQKWNSTKMPPPWVRNCLRNNNPPRGVQNEQRSSEDVVECKVGRDDSNYHHQHIPPVQNHHH